MIAYWPMDDNSGGSVEDVYGNNDGEGFPLSQDGWLLGTSAKFDGSDMITIPNSADLCLDGGSGFSIEFWVYSLGSDNSTLLNKGGYNIELIKEKLGGSEGYKKHFGGVCYAVKKSDYIFLTNLCCTR